MPISFKRKRDKLLIIGAIVLASFGAFFAAVKARAETIANAPVVAVAGASIFGYTLPEVAAAMTIGYTAYLWGRSIYKDWKSGRRSRKQ